jgi:hypothetical protein
MALRFIIRDEHINLHRLTLRLTLQLAGRSARRDRTRSKPAAPQFDFEAVTVQFLGIYSADKQCQAAGFGAR